MINARIYSSILLVILFMGMTASCTYDTSFVGEDSHANVTLTLSIGKQAIHASRATVADEGFENVIDSVELFFYKKANESDTAPLENATCDVHIAKSQLTTKDDGTTTVSFTMPANGFNNLFGIGTANTKTTCFVYAVANRGNNALPIDADGELDLTFSSVKKTVLTANFVSNAGVIQEQTSFVMDGLAQVSRTNNTNTISGNIPLERVAVKIGLSLVYDDEYEDEDGNKMLTVKSSNGVVEWTAAASDVEISLRRGSSKTYLGSTHYNADATPVDEEYIYSAQPTDIFSTDYHSIGTTFYTYPTNWETNENAHTHLMLAVEWTNAENSEETKTTYYEINVNPAGSFTQRNCFYQIAQQISILGSEEEEEPLPEENSSYKVLEWHDIEDEETNINTSTNAELSRPKYLVVDETAATMENTTTKRIYFYSSDPIDLVNNNDALTVKWHYTKNAKAEDLPFANKSNATRRVLANGDIQYVVSNTTAVSGVTNRIQGDYEVTVTIHNAINDNDESYIEVNHPLDNTMDAEADYTQYFIEFSVQHNTGKTGDSSYKETIKITQSPMISIFAEQNSEFRGNVDNTSWGYVFVNGNQNEWHDNGWQRVAQGLSLNKCPNRYIVSVSTLTNTEIAKNYIIGDPRTNSRKITGVTNRDLTNYLPTDRDGRTQKMISPQFMFSSSYGACPATMSKDDAERRCATYQEDGYPAGRWRLPTEAEVKYAIQLKGWGIIPELFSESQNYWSAHGRINGEGVNNGNGNNNTTAVVRCVYDTWYWGTDHTPGSTTYNYDDTRD